MTPTKSLSSNSLLPTLCQHLIHCINHNRVTRVKSFFHHEPKVMFSSSFVWKQEMEGGRWKYPSVCVFDLYQETFDDVIIVTCLVLNTPFKWASSPRRNEQKLCFCLCLEFLILFISCIPVGCWKYVAERVCSCSRQIHPTPHPFPLLLSSLLISSTHQPKKNNTFGSVHCFEEKKG